MGSFRFDLRSFTFFGPLFGPSSTFRRHHLSLQLATCWPACDQGQTALQWREYLPQGRQLWILHLFADDQFDLPVHPRSPPHPPRPFAVFVGLFFLPCLLFSPPGDTAKCNRGNALGGCTATWTVKPACITWELGAILQHLACGKAM